MEELLKMGRVAPGPVQQKKPSGWSTFGKALGGAAVLGGGAYLGRGLLRKARYAMSPYVAKSRALHAEATKAPDVAAIRSRAHGLVPGLEHAADPRARKLAIRKRMMELHPDKAGGSAEATKKYQELSEAVEAAYPKWKTASAMMKFAASVDWRHIASVFFT
jgi:hypothetical protein